MSHVTPGHVTAQVNWQGALIGPPLIAAGAQRLLLGYISTPKPPVRES